MCITSCRADSAYKDGATRPFFAPRLPLPRSRLLSPLDISSLLWYNGGGYTCGRRRLLSKCQILLTKVENCSTIMVEECTLVRGQTTIPHPDYYGRGGILIPSAAHPDYYTHAAGAGSRLLSSRKQDPDYYMYEAGQISSRKQQKQQEAGAGIGCRLW